MAQRRTFLNKTLLARSNQDGGRLLKRSQPTGNSPDSPDYHSATSRDGTKTSLVCVPGSTTRSSSSRTRSPSPAGVLAWSRGARTARKRRARRGCPCWRRPPTRCATSAGTSRRSTLSERCVQTQSVCVSGGEDVPVGRCTAADGSSACCDWRGTRWSSPFPIGGI